MKSKEYSVQSIKNQLGWAYSQLKWPREQEVALMNETRAALLQVIGSKCSYSFQRNKIHHGSLSPGCVSCGNGTWLCLYINGFCTGNCFFCPQDRKMKVERPPATDDAIFNDPADFADFVCKTGVQGVGFSGGEPLLVYPKLLSFITELRKKAGEEVYLWAYTNGDLIDEEKLTGLKNAGLNEIRVNIAARDYSLKPVETALHYFKTVSVEIPAIPEDTGKVKSILKTMESLGVSYLNLHQLLTTQHNYRSIAERNYTALHHPGIPIYESEMAALNLLRYVVENDIPLPLNYCSQSYKERVHSRSRRKRAGPYIRQDFEDITDAMYIRDLSVEAEINKIKQIPEALVHAGYPESQWMLNPSFSSLHLRPYFLPHIDMKDCLFTIKYSRPYFRDADAQNNNMTADKSIRELPLNANTTFWAVKEPVATYQRLSPILIQSYYKLYIEGVLRKEAVRWFSENYPLQTESDIKTMAREKEILNDILTWEQTAAGFPEIF